MILILSKLWCRAWREARLEPPEGRVQGSRAGLTVHHDLAAGREYMVLNNMYMKYDTFWITILEKRQEIYVFRS